MHAHSHGKNISEYVAWILERQVPDLVPSSKTKPAREPRPEVDGDVEEERSAAGGAGSRSEVKGRPRGRSGVRPGPTGVSHDRARTDSCEPTRDNAEDIEVIIGFGESTAPRFTAAAREPLGRGSLIHGDLSMSTITRRPPAPAVPMETTTVLDEERGDMSDVSWEFYYRISDAIGELYQIRVAYDGQDMEIMTLGPKHERSKEFLGPFVAEVCVGLTIDFEPMGSTTWKRSEEHAGLESDLCYFFDQVKLRAVRVVAAWESNDVAVYPNPDLAIEVDVSPSKIDRPKIYASLKVSEIWRSNT